MADAGTIPDPDAAVSLYGYTPYELLALCVSTVDAPLLPTCPLRKVFECALLADRLTDRTGIFPPP
ncbi:MAG: hypothetical protein JWN04_5022 [Myxococcaceae bacterium]|nr:hypothetical protein [Myxococcaceae bacterium]